MEEKISVVIPTYKRPSELERAIKSVKKQTYPNLEIIVIDDNAKEPEFRKKTKEVVQKFKDIIYIENKESQGGSGSRNIGIERATGNLIAFLDDDDEFLPEKIEKQKKFYDKLTQQGKKVGIVYCYANYIYPNKRRREVKKDFEGIPLKEHMISCIAATSWWLCSKKVLEEIKKFDIIDSHQDASLILKLLVAGYELYRVPEVLLNYYVHESKNGISGANMKNIKVDLYYRDICRQHYDKLTKKRKP